MMEMKPELSTNVLLPADAGKEKGGTHETVCYLLLSDRDN